MSVEMMTRVWEHSQTSGGTLLVLLAIADNARDSDGLAWPSVETIAHKTRLHPRNVQRNIRAAVKLGELGVEKVKGRVNRYQVLLPEMPGRQIAGVAFDAQTPGASVTPPLAPAPPRIISESSEPKKRARRSRVALPNAFQFTEAIGTLFREVGCTDPPRGFAQFRDVHTAKGTLSADWMASVRTWTRMHDTYGCPCQRPRGRPPEPKPWQPPIFPGLEVPS